MSQTIAIFAGFAGLGTVAAAGNGGSHTEIMVGIAITATLAVVAWVASRY